MDVPVTERVSFLLFLGFRLRNNRSGFPLLRRWCVACCSGCFSGDSSSWLCTESRDDGLDSSGNCDDVLDSTGT